MNLLRPLLTALLAISLLAAAPFAAAQLVEGKDYKRIKEQPVEAANKIEVIEFFSFGCQHCRDLEPHLMSWVKRMPPDVVFKRIPVAFSPAWKGFSKAYFTMEALGVAERLSIEFFESVHRDGKPLANEDAFYAWAVSKGLEKQKVEDLYKSFSINSKLTRADSMVKNYAVDSVPGIVVQGKYLTGSHMLKNGHADMPAAIDSLIALARKDKK